LPDLFRNPMSKEERPMSQAYSIDLGINAKTTGRHEGSLEDPFPLQIAVTEGTLVQDPETSLTLFKPSALASFYQIQGGDSIIFRIFDITKIAGKGVRQLVDVSLCVFNFTAIDGSSEASKPWPSNEAFPFYRFGDQLSLAFTSIKGGMGLPCYYQRDSTKGIVIYTVTNPPEPVPYLFSVQVETTIATTSELTGTFYYQDDPEMVVSPDEGQGPQSLRE
jgi:hypothetical protein